MPNGKEWRKLGFFTMFRYGDVTLVDKSSGFIYSIPVAGGYWIERGLSEYTYIGRVRLVRGGRIEQSSIAAERVRHQLQSKCVDGLVVEVVNPSHPSFKGPMWILDRIANCYCEDMGNACDFCAGVRTPGEPQPSVSPGSVSDQD